MIYTDQQLIEKIRKMIIDFEDEVVEFKEARTNYSFKDMGKYFSALGNEATDDYSLNSQMTCKLPELHTIMKK